MRNILISIIIVLLISIIGFFAYQKYTEPKTEFRYGTVSEGAIPEQFEWVELTMSVVDEEGKSSTHTFSVNTEDEIRPYVKLYVRNDKVVKYKFVEKSDLPSKALKQLE